MAKILNKIEMERLCLQTYPNLSFQDAVAEFIKRCMCTPLNVQKSKRKRYLICESVFKDKKVYRFRKKDKTKK